MKKMLICMLAVMFSGVFFFSQYAIADVVSVHVTGRVSSVREMGVAVGTTGVSTGETFEMTIKYDLDKGEFLNYSPYGIRHSYAEDILSGPWPYAGMSAHLEIGSNTWDMLSEEMNGVHAEAHVMLDDAIPDGGDIFQIFNLRLRTKSETLDGFHAHIFDSSINMGLYDGEEPFELFDELKIPTHNSDINYENINFSYLVVFSEDPDDWFGNSWEIKLEYDSIDISNVPSPEVDSDGDGVLNEQDNCPNHPNGPNRGTCTRIAGTNWIVSTGQECTSDTDCDPGEFCEKTQADHYPPSGNNIGDACDCECDFDCDGDVDAGDVESFLRDFGRFEFNNPCTNDNPCNGDSECDGDVDAGDVEKFLEDFGRFQFNNPCPACVARAWCVYPVDNEPPESPEGLIIIE